MRIHIWLLPAWSLTDWNAGKMVPKALALNSVQVMLGGGVTLPQGASCSHPASGIGVREGPGSRCSRVIIQLK